MGFESPPGRYFQNWADHSPRAETSTSLEGDVKDNTVIFLFSFALNFSLVYELFEQ